MQRWARFVTGNPRAVVWVTVVVILLSGLWGLGVLDRLNLAGYEDPASQSAHADELTAKAFGRQTPDVVAIYTAPEGRTIDDIRPQVLERLGAIDEDVLAKPVESYWSATGVRQLAMVSTDRRTALAAISLDGSMSDQLKVYHDLRSAVTVAGVDTRFAGLIPVVDAYNEKSKKSVVIAESVAIPLMLALLVIVFGGFVAASVPVIVGGLAMIGALGALRALSMVTDVSAFALNIASILGLGLAIDYGLFMVSRFREELGAGHTPVEAAQRAVRTAGRTIAFSGVLLICAFAGTMVFPPSMLRSLGFGAIAAIVIAAAVSVTALPAALSLLGERINALPWRRGAAQRGEARARTRWADLANWVMRRPVAVTLAIVVALLALSAPFLGIGLGGINPNVLPADDPVRVAQQHLAADFPNAAEGATILVRGDGGTAPASASVSQIVAAAQQTDGVRTVVRLGEDKDLVLLRALLTSPDFSPGSEDAVGALREIAAPPGTSVLVGGVNAIRADSSDSILDAIPLALTIVVVATLVVMAVAFRSIVLPIKAVVMAVVSLTATFGVLTWIFVDGHGASVFGAEAAPLPTPALIVVVVAVFGLSTDYEVFLMSRMIEARDRGASTEEAVREGVSKTGRIITTAAVLFMIVTAAAALSDVTLIKVAALGMTLAILIDATVVRMLLVPALVTLMGEANWWTPFGRARTVRAADVETPEPPEDRSTVSEGAAG
ncbi:MMPL family transporter [Nocardia arizonensis]|uniref:MMPL family transporter n=1 Tax=Nocardia arizonensis TaxID=1141647 RepID=UPI0006D1937D|nr:MMPL family transporter [Nocardia arizonensis]